MIKQRSTKRLTADDRPADAAADARAHTPADTPARTPADAQTFRAAVRDVTPLTHTPPAEGLAKPKPRPRLRNTDAPPAGGLPADEAAATAENVTGVEALSFQRAGVRTQVMRRLRRGLYPIDDEMDLHGLSQSAARNELADFIARSRERGCRCVRIIHGKGYRSGARGPVLKTAVNLWLRLHLDVLAFVSARAIDGGTGAMYVLLR
jgi:DNA-nicking Smr family endonuclease